jgi:hypothetical protein
MKTAKQITCVVAGMCLMFFCSGCLLTGEVRAIGVRNEMLQAHQILVATNGAVAIACTATYSYDGVDQMGANIENSAVEKYLVGSSEAVRWTIQHGHKAYYNSKGHRLASTNNVICLWPFYYGATNSTSWKIVLPDYGGRAATAADLPKEFQNLGYTCVVSNRDAFPYSLDGRDLRLQLPSNFPNRMYRKWWGYPAQILVLPAAVIDVVIAPVQVLLLAHALSNSPP